MHASIMLVALVAPPAPLDNPQADSPAWQQSYTTAREVGRKDHKPVAVVIGSGAKGWDKLSQDDSLSPAVQKLLADNYVCTYVDTATETGRRLANAFALSQGLVLSSPDGAVQAYRQGGRISNRDLELALRQHGTQAVSVRSGALEDQEKNQDQPKKGALGDQEESEDQPKKGKIVEGKKGEPGKAPPPHRHVQPAPVRYYGGCGAPVVYAKSCSVGCYSVRSCGGGRCGGRRCR